MENQKMPEYETHAPPLPGEMGGGESRGLLQAEIDRLSTVAVRQPDGSTKQINEDMRQSITKKLISPPAVPA